MDMEKLKMVFVLTAVVALAGVMFAGAGFAAAQAPMYLSLKAAERVDFGQVGHICNENNGGAGNSCGTCYDRAAPNGYADTALYCTNNAYTDCGSDGGGEDIPGPGYDSNKPNCYCDEDYAQNC